MSFSHLIIQLNNVSHYDPENLMDFFRKYHTPTYIFFREKPNLKIIKRIETLPHVQIFESISPLEIIDKINRDKILIRDETAVISDEPDTIGYFRAHGMGYLIGCGRDDKIFYEQCADTCITNLLDLEIDEVSHWFSHKLNEESWRLTYRYYNENEEKLRETMTTIGNGFVGHRGALSFMKANEDEHYPATYVAGLFNKVGTKIANKVIDNNDFVNIPNAFLVRFKFAQDDDFWTLNALKIKGYQHTLDMKTGEVFRYMLLEHDDGRQVKYTCRQFASMEQMHLLAQKITIEAVNFSDTLVVLSSIDGQVVNYGVERYRQLNSKHLKLNTVVADEGRLHLQAETTSSKVKIDLHVCHSNHLKAYSNEQESPEEVSLVYKKDLNTKNSFEIERTIYIQTSRNVIGAENEIRFRPYSDVLSDSKDAWSEIWNQIDIHIKGDRYSQELVRLQMYHLLCSASPHNVKLDAAMTARGLHGEAYRGHIFWDEVYIMPFYFKHFPEVAKSLLMYRYRRLDAARKNAQKNNKEGALIPWQIADTGEEETQEIHYNPMSQEWDPDLSRNQRHVSIAVAYNIINYYRHTEDEGFIGREGGEILLEIARYWASKVTYNKEDDRYHICRVMGPDEFHEKYPENSIKDGGIDNNAYTNLMVSWLLHYVISLLPKIESATKDSVNFSSSKEPSLWLEIANKLYLSIKGDILEQFEGYFNLKEIDLEAYEKQYDDIGRMDRILKSENDSPDQYKVAKQADTLMLFYLLEPENIKQLIENLGYEVCEASELLRRNYDYYVKRTSHGSTLSYIVHAYLLDNIPGREKQLWKWFQLSLRSDVDDIQGGTTEEGIHCGVMAGNINLIYSGFAGLKMGNPIQLQPKLPKHWQLLKFKITFQNHNYEFKILKDRIEVTTNKTHKNSIICNGDKYSFENDTAIRINT